MSSPSHHDLNAPSSDHAMPPVQFSLRRLFAIVTCIAVPFGLAHWFGAVPAGAISFVIFCAVGGYFAKPFVLGSRVLNMLAFSLSGLLLAGFVLPAFQGSACTGGRRSQCRNNIKIIGLGLQCYADVYGCFPPAFIADANGRPMHSWRVLILPFMEQKSLYNLYDFSEPWDGPHNRLLAAKVPHWLQCPSDPSLAGTANTSYVAITGPQTIWAGDTATEFGDISDGTSNTLAVVEVANSDINWMEPRDMPFSALSLGVNSPCRGGISSTHADIAHAVYCDGSAQALPKTISVKTLQALATKSGGEAITRGQ